MKVLFVATVMSHLKAFHLPYMKWFHDQGWEVHCVANDDTGLSYCDKKYVIPIARSPYKLKNIEAYRCLKAILKKEHFNIIHCHTPMGGMLARLAARKSRKEGTKVIYTAHGFHFYKGAPVFNWLFYYPVEMLLARYTDVLITINQEDYRRAQKLKAGKIEYVHGVGIETKKFLSAKINNTNKREELGIDKNKIVLLSVGEINKNKNHIIVLRALYKLKRESKLNNIVYLICGTGPLESWLRKKACDYGLQDVVYLLGKRCDIAEINGASDIFIFPSIREGLSVALMEAMACGLPVVCSRIRGNTDLIEKGRGGFLEGPYDAARMMEKIELLQRDVSLRKTMGENNRQAARVFSVDSILVKMAEIYAQCMQAQDMWMEHPMKRKTPQA